MARKTKVRGTDNVLADLGFADAEELSAKTVLAKKINDIVTNRGLTVRPSKRRAEARIDVAA